MLKKPGKNIGLYLLLVAGLQAFCFVTPKPWLMLYSVQDFYRFHLFLSGQSVADVADIV